MNDEPSGVKSKYFVAFDWKANGIYGAGSMVIERESPVSGWDDISNMTDYILSCNPDMEKVVISNWRKFEAPE